MGAVCTARLVLGRVSTDSLLCAPRDHRHAGLRLQGLPGRLSLVCALDTKRLGRRGARGPPGPSPWPAPHVSVTLQTLMGEEWPGRSPLRLSAPPAGSAPSQLPPPSSCKNARKRREPSLKHRDVSQVRVSFPRPLSLGLNNNPQQAKRKTETQRLGLNPSGLSATRASPGPSLRQTRPVRFFAGLEEGPQEAWGTASERGADTEPGPAGLWPPDTRLTGGRAWPRQPGGPWARALARRPRLLSAVAPRPPRGPRSGRPLLAVAAVTTGAQRPPLRHTRPPAPGLHGTPDARAL